MSVQYPPPGHNSTTVIVGVRPKKVSSSTGWRAASRATWAGLRAGLPTELTSAGSAGAATQAAEPARAMRVRAHNARNRTLCMAFPFWVR